MKIVLIRHGQAEHTFNKKDFDRELTKDGKKDVRAKTVQLAEKLKSDCSGEKLPLYCLTSAAARAKQTANIVLEELSERLDIEISGDEFPDFYFGEKTSILDRIDELPESSIVILVGHQPTLSYFAAGICNIAVPFQTGDMVCFEITDRHHFSGNLLWKISHF